jgi:hypothetical protein
MTSDVDAAPEWCQKTAEESHAVILHCRAYETGKSPRPIPGQEDSIPTTIIPFSERPSGAGSGDSRLEIDSTRARQTAAVSNIRA